jgi:hypothetical protein
MRMTPANSIEQTKEEEGTNVTNIERYMDIITADFAYDPVRLPIDQDRTQTIYNRKTLEKLWETTNQASSPFTREWFHIKSVIPQRDMREEMHQYIKHNKFSTDGAEFDVIEDYTKILEEGRMKEYLNILSDGVSRNLGLQKQDWVKMWKKMNLLRLYCQYRDENIQTFRGLNGFSYLQKLILQIEVLLNSDSTDVLLNSDLTLTQEVKEIKEAAVDVCKEILKAVDVIGFRNSDIAGENSIGYFVLRGLITNLCNAYNNSEGYPKIQSIVLRVFRQISDQNVVGLRLYQNIIFCLPSVGLPAAINILSRDQATEISSEDLNYGIAILRIAWMLSLKLYVDDIQVLINAVIICIARVVETTDKLRFTELQLLEAQEQERHNFEGLEKGLMVINDILQKKGLFADTIHDFDILSDIFRLFKYLTDSQNDNLDGMGWPNLPVSCLKGCSTSDCVHIRIARLALGIREAISKRER